MAYDLVLAERVRTCLLEEATLSERKMFGGLAFMLAGNMACGVVGDQLVVRVGPDDHEAALDEQHALPMDFTGRPMRGMVYVAPEGLVADEALASWVDRGASYARSLPAK